MISICKTILSGQPPEQIRDRTEGLDSAPLRDLAAGSRVLPAVGSPVPISRNCRIPASSARYRTARRRKARDAGAAMRITGATSMSCRAAARSTSKLSLPPTM